jgi:hypothetical protein
MAKKLSRNLTVEIQSDPRRIDVWRGVEWIGQWLLKPDGTLGPINGVGPLRRLDMEEKALIDAYLVKEARMS